MNAATVAKELTKRGVAVASFSEGDDSQDGEVTITPKVHVQVATFGTGRGVVMETARGTFKFYPERRTYEDLIRDIREATS